MRRRHRLDLRRHSLAVVCRFLGISTPFRFSSELGLEPELRREERVLRINGEPESTRYVNSIGSIGLYSETKFARAGIELRFLKPQPIEYRQFAGGFVPWLSIIDIMMFNPIDRIAELLERYELVRGSENSNWDVDRAGQLPAMA